MSRIHFRPKCLKESEGSGGYGGGLLKFDIKTSVCNIMGKVGESCENNGNGLTRFAAVLLGRSSN